VTGRNANKNSGLLNSIALVPDGSEDQRDAVEHGKMPEERVELSWGCPRRILSPLRLPFRHSGARGNIRGKNKRTDWGGGVRPSVLYWSYCRSPGVGPAVSTRAAPAGGALPSHDARAAPPASRSLAA